MKIVERIDNLTEEQIKQILIKSRKDMERVLQQAKMNRPKDLNAPSRWNMRIWDDDKKEWLCQSDKDVLTYYGFDITGGETTEFQGLPKWYPDIHLIWEQSAGVKDKNGIEVYEGDIVKITRELTKTRTAVYIYQIKYDNSRVAFTCWKNNHFACMFFENREGECEVIGNIHENPELLGGEE